jgi:hypothetical protein
MKTDDLHRMTAISGLLILLATKIGVVVFLLPFFEGYRTSALLVVVLPLAAAGLLMIVFQRYLMK